MGQSVQLVVGLLAAVARLIGGTTEDGSAGRARDGVASPQGGERDPGGAGDEVAAGEGVAGLPSGPEVLDLVPEPGAGLVVVERHEAAERDHERR